MPKTKPIERLTNIQPNTLYLVGKTLCTFVCSEEPGWLRGHVLVSQGFSPSATAIDVLNNRTIALDVHRRGDAMVFNPLSTRVFKVDDNYIAAAICQCETEITMLKARADQLMSLRDKYRTSAGE